VRSGCNRLCARKAEEYLASTSAAGAATRTVGLGVGADPTFHKRFARTKK
jgi:hypothetical protein